MTALRISLCLAAALFSALPGYCTHHAQAVLTLVRTPTATEIAHRNTTAKYEPSIGCYLGAYVDFDSSLPPSVVDQNKTEHRDPGGFEHIVGRAHSMYFFYLGYGKPLPLDWVNWLATRNKFVQIALEPNDGLKWVKDDKYLNRLADEMGHSGARIFLRFASEMNGRWTAYHRDPSEYRKKFKLVHDIMHKRAPNVAMVWCPYCLPKESIPDYYPGDDAVDWVGINMYNVTYHNNNLNSGCEAEHPCDMLDTVYNRYSSRKPIMVCEYGATHLAACKPTPRPDFACRKIGTFYNALPAIYPRVKCVNYFDSNTLQFAADLAYNDYCVTDDAAVRAAYSVAVASSYYLDAPLAARSPAPPQTPIPMPMKDGDKLRGNVEISCWARTPSDRLSVRYSLDHYRIYSASSPDKWAFIWPANKAAPGKHTLLLEVLNTNGKVVARQSVTVVVVK
jgi:hypothetical protein